MTAHTTQQNVSRIARTLAPQARAYANSNEAGRYQPAGSPGSGFVKNGAPETSMMVYGLIGVSALGLGYVLLGVRIDCIDKHCY